MLHSNASRIVAVLCAALLLVPMVLVSTATATTAPVPSVGVPLGYYYSEVDACQDNPYSYYHNRTFYNACQNARYIVSHAHLDCRNLTEFGIAFSIISVAAKWNAWASLAFVAGMGIGCLL